MAVIVKGKKTMKHPLFMSVCFAISVLVGCVSDGVEYTKDYVDSDNVLEQSDSAADKLQQSQYYFELGLKMAVLDKDTIGDWEGALKQLNKAIELQPEFQKAFHYRAIIQSDLQRYDDAMENINHALELDGNAIESFFVRAGLFANKGNFSSAMKDIDAIILLDADNGRAYDRRGYLKIELGDKGGGCQDLKKARELGYMMGNEVGDKFICE